MMFSPLDLIPPPYSLIVKIGLPVLAIVGVWIAGDIHGHHAQKHSDEAQIAVLQGTIANMKAASEQAKAANTARVQTVETKQDQITKDHENDYSTQLAAARAALAAYKRMHPATAQGDTGHDPVSQVPDAAGKPDAATDSAVVSGADLDRCAQAYVTATGLQDWIRGEAAIAR